MEREENRILNEFNDFEDGVKNEIQQIQADVDEIKPRVRKALTTPVEEKSDVQKKKDAVTVQKFKVKCKSLKKLITDLDNEKRLYHIKR